MTSLNQAADTILAGGLPSPQSSILWIGPLPLRAYAICIILGVVAAVMIGSRRMKARGGTGQEVVDITLWAVLLGIVGGRLYHVITSPNAYFGPDGDPARIIRVWDGGLGVWGAIALGAVGVWIGARRHGHNFLDIADAVAPGILVAQALGRWGNWFNNELYGSETDLPWRLTVYDFDVSAGVARTDSAGDAIVLGTYHPTFLYESLWCLIVALALVIADRRFRFARGQVISLYVVGYTLGRLWIEMLRTDSATMILGQRINVWVAIAVCLAGIVAFVLFGRRGDYPVRGAEAEPGDTTANGDRVDAAQDSSAGAEDDAQDDDQDEVTDARADTDQDRGSGPAEGSAGADPER